MHTKMQIPRRPSNTPAGANYESTTNRRLGQRALPIAMALGSQTVLVVRQGRTPGCALALGQPRGWDKRVLASSNLEACRRRPFFNSRTGWEIFVAMTILAVFRLTESGISFQHPKSVRTPTQMDKIAELGSDIRGR